MGNASQTTEAPSSTAESSPSPSRVFFREFIVDLLGSLVPGYVFTVASTLAFLLPCFALVRILAGAASTDPLLSNNVKDVVSTFRFELIGSILVFSYITGCLLYRQTPKKPDEQSWKKYISKEERDGGPVGPVGRAEVEFPYYFLYEYLTKRGLGHLASLVRWRGEDKTTHDYRTKHFINCLKTRIEFEYPERYSVIARNEGHVRLMSSGWYCNRALVRVSACGLALGALCVVAAALLDRKPWPFPYCWTLLGPALVLASAVIGNRFIERAFHYVRRREVLNVLEITYWASKHNPSILDGLVPTENDMGLTITGPISPTLAPPQA